MRLALIRHGQTDLNLEGRLQGTSDWPLNATGVAQAREAVHVLRATGVPWSVVVSSPLQRARRTAELIAEGLGVPLGESYDDLIERDYGRFEAVLETEADKQDPSVETLDSVVRRGRRALDAIATAHPDADVVVVCHGTIIRYTLAALAGRPIEPPRNGTTAQLRRDADGGWTVLTVNDEPLPAA